MALAQIIGIDDDAIEINSDNIEEPPVEMPLSFMQEISPDNRAEISMLKEKTAIMESKKILNVQNLCLMLCSPVVMAG